MRLTHNKRLFQNSQYAKLNNINLKDTASDPPNTAGNGQPNSSDSDSGAFLPFFRQNRHSRSLSKPEQPQARIFPLSAY
jgi:hypothetical protein